MSPPGSSTIALTTTPSSFATCSTTSRGASSSAESSALSLPLPLRSSLPARLRLPGTTRWMVAASAVPMSAPDFVDRHENAVVPGTSPRAGEKPTVTRPDDSIAAPVVSPLSNSAWSEIVQVRVPPAMAEPGSSSAAPASAASDSKGSGEGGHGRHFVRRRGRTSTRRVWMPSMMFLVGITRRASCLKRTALCVEL
jgi:hypothetical protein